MPFSIRPDKHIFALVAVLAMAVALVAAIGGGATRSEALEGQFLHFTGPDAGYLEVPDDPALNPTSEITIEAWVYVTSGVGWGTDGAGEGCPTIVGKNYQAAYWFGLDCNGSTALQFYAAGLGTNSVSTGSIDVNTWVHVAVTYDSTDVKFYVNGALDSTVNLGVAMTTSNYPLEIGRDVMWDSSPIGHIDEVHLWNVARTGTEVAADMDPIKTPQIGLVGAWNMEGSANATVGGFTGTLVGDAEFSGTPITPSPTLEPPFDKGDTDCNHAQTAADALPILYWISGSGTPLFPCENPSVTAAGGLSEWWDASSGAGYIEVPDDSALSPTDAITIELQINAWSYYSPDNLNTCPSLVGKGYHTAYWLGLCSGHLRFYPRGTGSQVDSDGALPLRQWVNVAVVADQTSVKFYINGELDSEFTNDAAPLTTDTNPLRIGSDFNYNYQPWASLDNVRIWNVARSEADIQADIAPPPVPPQAGLVADYPLDGNADDIANAHNGAAVGTVAYGTSLPSPYWPDINCSGLLDVHDVIDLLADTAGVALPFPLIGDCEAIGTATG